LNLILFQVDAFTNRPFTGNPAAVCLLDDPGDPAWMQDVAREINLPERITSREIVPTGRIFPLFSPRMTGPDPRSPLRSCTFLATGKEFACSWHGYDFS